MRYILFPLLTPSPFPPLLSPAERLLLIAPFFVVAIFVGTPRKVWATTGVVGMAYRLARGGTYNLPFPPAPDSEWVVGSGDRIVEEKHGVSYSSDA